MSSAVSKGEENCGRNNPGAGPNSGPTKSASVIRGTLMLAALLLVSPAPAPAQTETVL